MRTIPELDAEHLASLRAYLETYAARLPVRRVAVVGNAPLKPDAERAALVDSADLVFRVNSFVLDEPGDEPCLGSRVHVVVTARATRPTPWFFRDYPSRAYLVMDAGNMRRPYPPEALTWPDDLGAWPISNRVLGFPLKLRMRPENNAVGAVPTTGTMAAYLAHEVFAGCEILLTGFSFLHDRGQTSWAHHYGTVAPVHGAHLLDREGAIMQEWVDAGTATYLD